MLISGGTTTMTGSRAELDILHAYILGTKAAEREMLPRAHWGMSKAEGRVWQ